jgi:replication factor C small subunit
MDEPLWTEAHAPALGDLPQAGAREHLQRAIEEPVNLVVHGPPGAGKTAAVRALADEVHDHDDDFVELNVSDFFDRTKAEIRDDPRFEGFLQGKVSWTKGADRTTKYKRDWAKRDMINHVLTEFASYAPVSGAYKTILLDNAESVREDFQQALRRVMERHHETTQFVIATRQPTKLIPAIRSRCFPVPVPSPEKAAVKAVLADIADAEGVAHDEEGLGYVAAYADGNLRRAVLAAQTVAEEAGAIEGADVLDPLAEVGPRQQVESMLDDAESNAFTDARSTLDDLLVDEGYSGEEVLAELRRVAPTRYDGAELAAFYRLVGDVDFELARGTNDRLHVAHLLAELGR